MPKAAHNLEQEYWRPPQRDERGAEASPPARPTADGSALRAMRHFLPLGWSALRRSLKLNGAGLAAFCLGLMCLGLAAGIGLFYTAQTVLESQAIQLWRIEFLLAGIAALLAGLLLNRP